MQERVLVTGASGYLASWIVYSLLNRGMEVHGTVRNLHDQEKIDHLLKLGTEYPGKLKLFEADLLKPRSFDRAIVGCDLVIHSASPYLFEQPKSPEEQLLRPAMEGTRNVISSVERTPSVQRVVLTSSIVALYNSAREIHAAKARAVNTENINHSATPENNPYAYAKTRAEALAWELQQQQQRWSLVTIHPGAIFGPSLSRRMDSTSVTMMRQFLNGSFRRGVPRLWLGLVDVRDAAEAHVTAALRGESGSRYIAVAESLRLLDIARLIDTERFNLEQKLPTGEAPKWLLWLIAPLIGMRRRYIADNVNYPLAFDNQSSRNQLNLTYNAPAKTLNDHVAQLLSDKLVRE
ncbi:NAD-dependent epimerase/dehydratase family protein [Microbulbifer celer]|uniref:NAD-dependent epimerase/dehydratase family protein n=1 Tax=Microbulbifer celer TaxID=435905 RepID=A0ABW3U9T9_9GAMM|nr:NAD-dependent epimerase/dehydratase family protein [Microbulbifer celer]UFN58875.1 NAD-dependent epimerase/dehydratase family protein [Microbulbifer celer]